MPQRNIKGLAGLAAQKLVDATKRNAKKFGKWATSEPSETWVSSYGSPRKRPLPDYFKKGPDAKGIALSSTDVVREGLNTTKRIAQAAGRGAGRLAYGTIAPTPKSVKPNTKKKK